MENTTIPSVTDQHLETKNSPKYLAPIIILSIIAVLGVGFGVFSIIANQQANQKISTLDKELAQKDETLKQVEEKLGTQIEIKPEEGNEKNEPATNVNISAAKNYIYIGEWGIKIKIPDNLISVSYTMVGGHDLLYVSGAEAGGHYYPEFLEYSISHGIGLGALDRISKMNQDLRTETNENGTKMLINENGYATIIAYENSDYYFTYSHTQALVGAEDEEDWEVKSTSIVEDMLLHGISEF